MKRLAWSGLSISLVLVLDRAYSVKSPSGMRSQAAARSIAIATALAFVAIAAAGCSTMTDVIANYEQGKGTVGVYLVSVDQAWSLAKTVLREAGAGPIEENRSTGYMLAEFGVWTSLSLGPGGWGGTLVGIWVSDGVNSHEAKITIVTKQRAQPSASLRITEMTLHDRLTVHAKRVLLYGGEAFRHPRPAMRGPSTPR